MSKNRSRDNQARKMEEKKKLLFEEAEEFAKLSPKRYRKKYGGGIDEYDDYKKKKKKKKKIDKDLYYTELLDRLAPDVIEWCLRYGFRPENQPLRDKVYARINDPKFLKWVNSYLGEYKNLKDVRLLPVILRDIIIECDKRNHQAANDPNIEEVDTEAATALCLTILKKPMKKMVKKGIEERLAFASLAIIPHIDIMEYSPSFRLSTLVSGLYNYSKGASVPFGSVVHELFKKDETDRWIRALMVFVLLERKEKFGTLTDNQKKLYMDITTWVFKTLENSDKETIRIVLNDYVRARQRDDRAGKDTNRRYALSSLSEQEYKNITNVMKAMIFNDESIAKYF